MKQVVQSYKTGKVSLLEVPVPHCGTKRILVRNTHSLVSTGTERSTIELGQKSLLGKARARPDLLKRALEKARQQGFIKTFQEAMGRLDVPTPLGYSSSGVVVEAGASAHEFTPGDRVACIGQNYAGHAELVSVPMNMACRIPDNVTDEAAAFAMLGTIALHGVRCANLTFGSTVVVLGLGLLGLLAIQILKAYGCRVIALDIAANKVALAQQLGITHATDSVASLREWVAHLTQGQGVDSVIITAATQSDEPIHLAVESARVGGKVVLVGVADIHPNRNEMWRKQVEIVVSKAAGAGSLDPAYENNNIDWPINEVRWTQKRNLEEFLRLLSIDAINVAPLISHRYAIENAEQAYQEIFSNKMTGIIGVLFDYPNNSQIVRKILFSPQSEKINKKNNLRISVMGGGLFAKALLLPALAKLTDVHLQTLVTASGASAQHSAKRFGFSQCATEAEPLFAKGDTDAIIAVTPHRQHAELIAKAVRANKPLFIEKPLCTSEEELQKLQSLFAEYPNPPLIMVGHNRRYSPHSVKIQQWLRTRHNPLVMQLRVNSGFVPREHWVHSEEEGRSRIVGEMSHFIDLMQFYTNELPVRVYAERISGNDVTALNNDNIVVTFKFSAGSVATLTYSAQGDKKFSREHIEIFFDGNAIVCTDFCRSKFYSHGRVKKFKTRGQALGYREELAHFVACARGEVIHPISVREMFWTMRVIFAIEQSLATGQPITLRTL